MRSSHPPLHDGPTSATDEFVHVLRAVHGFGSLGPETLAELARSCSSVKLRVKQRLHLGDDGLYVVAAGRGRVVRSGAEDRLLTLHYVSRAEVFGEERLLAEPHASPDRGELLAVDAMRLVHVPARPLRALLETQPRLTLALFEVAARRASRLEERLLAVLTRPVEARICDFIIEASALHGVEDSRGQLVAEKFTHLEIAQYVGATRETVTLALGALRRAGVIAFDRRRVVVLDGAALRARVWAAA